MGTIWASLYALWMVATTIVETGHSCRTMHAWMHPMHHIRLARSVTKILYHSQYPFMCADFKNVCLYNNIL